MMKRQIKTIRVLKFFVNFIPFYCKAPSRPWCSYQQLRICNGNIKLLEDIKIEFHLRETHKIYWLQITNALPKSWKDIILKDKVNAKNLVIFDHHIVRKSQICSLNKLTSKELYLILVDANTVKPTAQDYFENLFESSDFNWKKNIFSNSKHYFGYKGAYVPV